jgi:hypothetical protein
MPQRDALAPRAYLQPLLQLEVTKRTAERHLERRAQCDRYPAFDFARFRSPLTLLTPAQFLASGDIDAIAAAFVSFGGKISWMPSNTELRRRRRYLAPFWVELLRRDSIIHGLTPREDGSCGSSTLLLQR